MNEKEQVLLENFQEYYIYAVEALKKNKYNVATTLFFKAIATGCDIIILREDQTIPTNHNERFKILREKHQQIYRIADRDFPFYQQSYTAKMNKETATMLKEDADTIKKKIKL
jgi:hypothetical protein